MTNSVWFEGIDDLNTIAAELRTSGVRAMVTADRVVRSATFSVQSWAQRFAPVDTGFLRSSITVEFKGGLAGGSLEGIVGPEASYAPYVEWGTSRQAPQGFMGPALDRVAPSFYAAIEAMADPLAPPRTVGVSAGGRLG